LALTEMKRAFGSGEQDGRISPPDSRLTFALSQFLVSLFMDFLHVSVHRCLTLVLKRAECKRLR
jgi:hypothetical protein